MFRLVIKYKRFKVQKVTKTFKVQKVTKTFKVQKVQHKRYNRYKVQQYNRYKQVQQYNRYKRFKTLKVNFYVINIAVRRPSKSNDFFFLTSSLFI